MLNAEETLFVLGIWNLGSGIRDQGSGDYVTLLCFCSLAVFCCLVLLTRALKAIANQV